MGTSPLQQLASCQQGGDLLGKKEHSEENRDGQPK
jgi:hypothetical protein